LGGGLFFEGRNPTSKRGSYVSAEGSSGSGGDSGNVFSIRRSVDEVEKLMDAALVSETFKVSESKIYKAAKKGDLPSFLLWGRLRRFRLSEVEAWLQQQRPNPRNPGPNRRRAA
jgi:excisionase family DNA binding protein